jgi:hypothetical protein
MRKNILRLLCLSLLFLSACGNVDKISSDKEGVAYDDLSNRDKDAIKKVAMAISSKKWTESTNLVNTESGPDVNGWYENKYTTYTLEKGNIQGEKNFRWLDEDSNPIKDKIENNSLEMNVTRSFVVEETQSCEMYSFDISMKFYHGFVYDNSSNLTAINSNISGDMQVTFNASIHNIYMALETKKFEQTSEAINSTETETKYEYEIPVTLNYNNNLYACTFEDSIEDDGSDLNYQFQDNSLTGVLKNPDNRKIAKIKWYPVSGQVYLFYWSEFISDWI